MRRRFIAILFVLLMVVMQSASLALVPPDGEDPPTGVPDAPDFEGTGGAEPGNEFVILPPTEDTVYVDTEPSGFLSCTEVDPETQEEFTADYANDEILAIFTPDATMTEIEAAFSAAGVYKKRYMTWLVTWVVGLNTPATTCSELQDKVDLLKAQAKVVSVWKNQLAELAAVPNDPYFGPYGWNLDRIGVPTAWDTEKGKYEYTTMGAVDTGVDKDHPDLSPNLRSESDWYNIDPKYYPEHGTGTAGIMSAKTDNALGVSGIVWNGKLIAKFTTRTDSDVKTKINYLLGYSVSGGMPAMNLSLITASVNNGGLRSATNKMLRYGVLPIGAAGNENQERIQYPAGFERCMAVGATDDVMSGLNQVRCNYPNIPKPWGSNWGPADGKEHINMMAPGIDTASTKIDGYRVDFGGTSGATPHVTGVAGLVRSEFQSMGPLDLWHRIEDSASDAVVHLYGNNPIPGYDRYTGWGFLQAQAAVASDATTALTITRSKTHLICLPVWPKENPSYSGWQQSAFIENVLPTAAQVGATSRYIAKIKPGYDVYYRENPSGGNPLLGTVRPYEGFFVKYNGGTGNINVAAQGARAGLKSGHRLEFPLWNRWNMFGNPFFEDITLSDNNISVRRVVETDTSVSYEEKSLSDAIAALWISRTFWYWNPDTAAYGLVYVNNSHTMPPYRGYFLFSNKPNNELYLIVRR